MLAPHKHSKNVNYSALVNRIGGGGADAWLTHYQAVAARERGEDVLILSVGDPDLETPAPVIERAVAQLRGGDTHYLPAAGRPALREAIARAHAARGGQAVGAENVVYFAGAQNALFAASLCLAGPGDEVVTFEPLYPTYPATIEVSGARLVRVPAAAGWRPDLAALAAHITPRTRALLWASPNNPSGVVLSEAELGLIAGLARRHDLWLIVDEVYAGLAPGGRVPSLAARLPERVVTLGSLSKSHAMTGWRAGWLVGPPELCLHAEKLAMCMLFGLPGFIQEAAITALTLAPEAEERIRGFCAVRQQRFAAAIRDMPRLRAVPPEAGMFMLIDVSATGLSGAEFARALYASERVSVLDGAAFGRSSAGCVRVCFATEEATLDAAAARLRRFCDSLARRSSGVG
jgi:aspartate/methionine/tyrosine aminotransferase